MRDELLRLLDMTRDVYTDRSGNAALEKVRAGLRALAAKINEVDPPVCGEPSAPPAQPLVNSLTVSNKGEVNGKSS